ncbi:DUF3916 domain-containing protein [Pseudomonas putida]|uniref:DUF3916 domain-containing protein n=1 Tax=Pseudomonas putida TaxID=303 RepID=UPI003D99F227
MRRIAVNNKPLKGIHRRLRALEHWASTFRDEFHPRSEHMERYTHWKIPVHAALVEGPHARIEDQAFCIQQLLEAACHLSNAADRTQGYYRVACLLTWPWVHQSEIAIFYDQDYYLRFLGESNTLKPKRISHTLALRTPTHFIEHGNDVTQADDEVAVQWWCIGEPA